MTETTHSKQLVTVGVPIYTTNLRPAEVAALQHTRQVLAGRDIAIVAPTDLDLSPLTFLQGIRVERFEPSFFAGREGYNRLMMSAELYERFIDSEFVLICQSDVWIFSDDLDRWCTAGYDYVGAPWLPDRREVSGFWPVHRLLWQMRKLRGTHGAGLKYKVGNGGLSLRRTAPFAQVAKQWADEIEQLSAPERGPKGFEDVLWSVTLPELHPGTIKVAPWREALEFSVEGHPDYALQLLQGKLPMGAHAYGRKRNRRHWQGIIPAEAF